VIELPYAYAMNDREFKRFEFRIALFTRRDQPMEKAEQLADRLLQRDRELDTRHICLECKGLQRDMECFPLRQGVDGVERWEWRFGRKVPYAPVIADQLFRCDHFDWVTP